ncbi:uncharacterized protein ARMOST_14981 [Armillaria ostoyae]|uniref:Uncharacterized protein n=1 Tax=Armillaria ostoyae TaxID=47428 RepID=A0A284RS30_ARMOS|nr:uncharacterized protein ARMOST_14981 [Armillaria ostoyae]
MQSRGQGCRRAVESRATDHNHRALGERDEPSMTRIGPDGVGIDYGLRVLLGQRPAMTSIGKNDSTWFADGVELTARAPFELEA